MVGLSREFAVLSGKEAHYPDISVKECDTPIDGKVKVSIDDDELCSRYTARLLLNVKIGKSPMWMQQRLRKSGVRPINNVVDATNYTMIELASLSMLMTTIKSPAIISLPAGLRLTKP